MGGAKERLATFCGNFTVLRGLITSSIGEISPSPRPVYVVCISSHFWTVLWLVLKKKMRKSLGKKRKRKGKVYSQFNNFLGRTQSPLSGYLSYDTWLSGRLFTYRPDTSQFIDLPQDINNSFSARRYFLFINEAKI